MTDEPATTLADDLTDAIGFQIGRLSKLRDRTNAQIAALTNGEVEPAAYSILFQLIHCGPLRSGALAESLFTDASTISRQVATLVRRGLIERHADPADGRVSLLAVTDAGRAVATRIRQRRNEALDQVMREWTVTERELFADLIVRFVDGFEITRQQMVAELTAHKDPQSYYAPPENNS